MLNNKDYCDYETCVALKELGFIGQGRCYYDLDKEPNKLRHFGIQVLTTRSAGALNFVLAVHLYDAQKWMREIHDIFVMIDRSFAASNSWHYVICANDDFEHLIEQPSLENYSYEEALLEGVRASIEILKEK